MSKIVVIKYAAMGDVLRTTAILPGLKENFPASDVYWITEAESKPLLLNNPFIKGVLLECELTEHFKQGKYDLIINMDEDYDACQLTGELKGKVCGFYLKEGKIACSQAARYWMSLGLLGPDNRDSLKKANKETYQKIIYDIAGVPYRKDFKPTLYLRADEEALGRKFAKKYNIGPNDYVVGVNTGAGARWPLKKLSETKTAGIINKLLDNGIRVILLGGKEEAERNIRIRGICRKGLIYAACDMPVREFVALMNICAAVITADTLAMHISIALNKYTLAFFGPTPAQEIEFYNNGEAYTAPLECVCCMKKVVCSKKPNCMDLLKEDLIVGKILQHKQKVKKN